MSTRVLPADLKSEIDRLARAPRRSLNRPSLVENFVEDKGRPGVYTIWIGRTFLYVGISYRDKAEAVRIDPLTMKARPNRRAQGVFGRLLTHATPDPRDRLWFSFCERFIIPELTREELTRLREGSSGPVLAVDPIVARLAKHLATDIEYAAIVTADGSTARAIETEIRRNGMSGFPPPILNRDVAKIEAAASVES